MTVPAKPFGLSISSATAEEIARLALTTPRAPSEGVGLVVTPNIEHIARLRSSSALAQAYRNASVIVCEGWPVLRYAQFCGLKVGRVTGCDITTSLMRSGIYADWHRIFLVLDSAQTEAEVRRWAVNAGLGERISISIPPIGFENDDGYCRSMAEAVRSHGTTLLIMAVGAPRSEIFVDRYRSLLPPCWAFCVGQAVKIALGIVQRAPNMWQAVGLEWLWRLRQEPRRLTRRYVVSSIGFCLAVAEDRRRVRQHAIGLRARA